MGQKPKVVDHFTDTSFITEAAKPLLLTCEDLIGYPRAQKKVQRAREYIEKAMTLLDEAVKESSL